MASGNDGITPPPPPGIPAQQTQLGVEPTKLPLWSFIFGIASFIQCLPVVGGALALIFGFMGRKRAREQGLGTGLATAGIILGIIGLVMSVVLTIMLFATGFAILGSLVNQTQVAQQLKPAEAAAYSYGASKGSFEGLSTEALAEFGFQPSGDVVVKAVPTRGGASFCIEGAQATTPTNVIHVPATAGETAITIDVNGVSYKYATGTCPA